VASVERHGNRFRVVWRVDGVKRRRSFDTEAEARAFADNSLAIVGRYTIDISALVPAMPDRDRRPSPTVIEFARPLVEDPNLGAASRDIYRNALRKIDDSVLGETPLDKVTPSDMREFMNVLTSDRRNVHQFLAKVFNAAVNDDFIVASPLARGRIRRPPQLQKEVRPLSVEEINLLVDGTLNQREALCIKIGAFVGLRGGEVGGLRAEDVDTGVSKLHVRQNATVTSEGRAIGSLKTKASRRSLTVAPSLMREIVDYVAASPPDEDGLIFRTERGRLMTAWELSRTTQRAARRVGLRPVSFHHLRHTCASLLIHAGVPGKAIQQYLGHSSIRVTMDIYGHLFPTADGELAASMEAIIKGASREAFTGDTPSHPHRSDIQKAPQGQVQERWPFRDGSPKNQGKPAHASASAKDGLRNRRGLLPARPTPLGASADEARL